MANIQNIVNIIIALLLAILVHELAHALVATWLGDDTPRRACTAGKRFWKTPGGSPR